MNTFNKEPPQREMGYYWVRYTDDDEPFIALYSYIEGNKYVGDQLIGREREYGWETFDVVEFVYDHNNEDRIVILSERLIPPNSYEIQF